MCHTRVWNVRALTQGQILPMRGANPENRGSSTEISPQTKTMLQLLILDASKMQTDEMMSLDKGRATISQPSILDTPRMFSNG